MILEQGIAAKLNKNALLIALPIASFIYEKMILLI
jgi:hypothetical protein